MPSELWDVLSACGMSSKTMVQRKKLIDFAWEQCERRTPYVLDQLLTHGGVWTGIRILAIISMFGYEEASKLYPALREGTIDPPTVYVYEEEGPPITEEFFGEEGVDSLTELMDEDEYEKENLKVRVVSDEGVEEI